MDSFPSMKTKKLLRILMRKPLNYEILRQKGSHRVLISEKYPRVQIGYHDNHEVSGSYVKDLLLNDVCLTLEMAKEVIQ